MRKSDKLKRDTLNDFKSKELLNKTIGFLTVIENIKYDNKNYWKCRCICNKEKEYTTNTLLSRAIISCGCKNLKIKNLSGIKINKLTILNKSQIQNKKHFILWDCLCECGKIVSKNGTKLKTHTIQSCGCDISKTGTKRANWKGYGDISMYNFTQIKNSAIGRNIEFNVTIEQLWNLYIKQNKKCSLSGLDIVFASRKVVNKKRDSLNTASLDRIDSSIGYLENNIQWVHKHINFMKQSYSQEYFIELCKNVVVYSEMEK